MTKNRSRVVRRDDGHDVGKAKPRSLTTSGRPRATVSHGRLVEPPKGKDHKRERAARPYWFMVTLRKGMFAQFKTLMKTIKGASYHRMY